jgi:hypothetical protein
MLCDYVSLVYETWVVSTYLGFLVFPLFALVKLKNKLRKSTVKARLNNKSMIKK